MFPVQAVLPWLLQSQYLYLCMSLWHRTLWQYVCLQPLPGWAGLQYQHLSVRLPKRLYGWLQDWIFRMPSGISSRSYKDERVGCLCRFDLWLGGSSLRAQIFAVQVARFRKDQQEGEP